MSIFSNILAKIFPSSHAANAPTGADATPATTVPGAAPAPAPEPVDIEQVLGGLAAKHPEKLNWRTSIVDLMKLLGLDSSLANRKSLATELGYQGDMNDSATMNMWLQKQVMQKLAANGGKVPAELM
jgi:hypothetical protein